jgi:hypothetical protein
VFLDSDGRRGGVTSRSRSKSKSPKKAKDTQTMTKAMTKIVEAPDLGPSILMDDELGLEVGREVALGSLK